VRDIVVCGSGTLAITIGASTIYVACTGTTSTSFTGCSGGSGTLATGDVATGTATSNLTYNSVDSLADTVTATGADAGTIGSPGLASVQFSNVSTVTANASQSSGAALTLNVLATPAILNA